MHFHQEEESVKEKAPGAAALAEDPQEQSFFKKYVYLLKKFKSLNYYK